MKIRSKLTISTIVAVLLMLTLGSTSITLIYRLAGFSQNVVETQQTVVKLAVIKGLTQNIFNLTELHIKFEDGVSMGLVAEKIEELEEQVQEALTGHNGVLVENPDSIKLKQFHTVWQQFEDITSQVIGLSDLFLSHEADTLLIHDGLSSYAESSLILDNQIKHYQSTAVSLGRKASAAEFASEVLIAAFTIIIVGIVIYGGLVMSRSITNPLLRLADYLRSNSLSSESPFGENSKEINDELRTLIHSLEIQVQNRTEELLESNKLLEKEVAVRRKTEEEVKKSERRYRQIFNNTTAWMAYTSIEGDFFKTNISLLKNLGYSAAELKQMNLRDLVPDKYQDQLNRFQKTLLEVGKAEGIVTMVGKNGATFILDYQSNVIQSESNPEASLAVHFAKDITQQKEAENAFHESELRFQNLVNTLPLAYFITGDQQSLIFANHKTRETFSWIPPEAELSNSDFLKILIPEDRNRAILDMAESYKKPLPNWQLYSCQREDGSTFPCEILTTPLNQNSGHERFQHILVDVSERLEKEELIKQKEVAETANQAISEWLSFVAHELRNPLGGIVSFAKFGLQNADKAPSEKLFSYFNQIYSAADRLEILLSDLLDLSKMEIGQMNLDKARSDILMLATEVQMENEALLAEKGLTLTVNQPDDGSDKIVTVCDRYRIGQVLRNLFSNAIKFTPPGRRIMVSFEKNISPGRRESDESIECIQVNVIDEGMGIPEDQLELVFNKYKQSRKTRIGEGTGLGLPICKEIIKAHNGKIWVNSIENEGTTFSFTLPVNL